MTKILLNTKEAAELISLSKNYLEKLRCNGDGPEFIRFGRVVRYDPNGLIAWVKSRKKYKNTSESYQD